MLTYAVGDVHGCSALLDELLARIASDAGARRHRLVFLGDYIDRGPDSAGVIARLQALQAGAARSGAPDDVICLQGNHEDLMLRARADPENVGVWLQNGGDATLASFSARSIGHVPEAALAWIAGCPTHFADGERIFVHAGLRPGRPLDEQTDRDRLWIRDTFLVGDHDFGAFVVHGHTPRLGARPEQRAHRVNLDTGAVYGGRLTAGIFTQERASPAGFIQVGPEGA